MLRNRTHHYFQFKIKNNDRERNGSLSKRTFEETFISSKPCQLPFNRYHLTAEGYLTACCVDYELDLVFGNIKEDSLKNIWNNDTVQKLRDKHIKDELSGLLCDQCMNNRPAPYKPLMKVKKKIKSSQLRKNKLDKLIKRFKEI